MRIRKAPEIKSNGKEVVEAEIIRAPQLPVPQRPEETFRQVITLNEAQERRQALEAYIKSQMKDGEDFGIIPGTKKTSLLKAGAEKLLNLYGLMSRVECTQALEAWDSKPPRFNYVYAASIIWPRIIDGQVAEQVVAQCEGSCGSMETKYRWRESNRKCPACGKEAIIKGKAEFGGGWLCFAKKGGCGKKFTESDDSITSQKTGRVENEDTADLPNTLRKMAQKRAIVGATILAVKASDLFSQDMEDVSHPAPTPAPMPQEKAAAPKAAPEPEAEVAIPKKESKPDAPSKKSESAFDPHAKDAKGMSYYDRAKELAELIDCPWLDAVAYHEELTHKSWTEWDKAGWTELGRALKSCTTDRAVAELFREGAKAAGEKIRKGADNERATAGTETVEF